MPLSKGFEPFLAIFFLVCVYPAVISAKSTAFPHQHHKKDSLSSPSDSSGRSYKSVAYYVNWATYIRNFQPSNLTVDTLTHLHYAFAFVSPSNGTVYLSDPYADLQKKFPTDSPNVTGNNLYGCLGQLYLLKKQNRHLKTLLSIGGASQTDSFTKGVAVKGGRQAFVKSSIALLSDLGFDGLDLDWEGPTTDSEAKLFVAILEDLRTAMDDYALDNNLDYKFILTAAVQANPKKPLVPHFTAAANYLDYWGLMAYDYAGSFTNLTGHMANLYPSKSNNLSTPFSTERALNTYLSAGVPSHKIMLGMPLYGRSFLQTTGMGKPYNGVGNGSWGQLGIWDYKALPQPGAIEVYDDEVGGSYSYAAAAGSFSGYGNSTATKGGNETIVSYDNKETAEKKASYIVEKGLGGGLWWESSGDKAGEESLIGTVAGELKKCGGLDQTENWLKYPTSQYDNVRSVMNGK